VSNKWTKQAFGIDDAWGDAKGLLKKDPFMFREFRLVPRYVSGLLAGYEMDFAPGTMEEHWRGVRLREKGHVPLKLQCPQKLPEYSAGSQQIYQVELNKLISTMRGNPNTERLEGEFAVVKGNAINHEIVRLGFIDSCVVGNKHLLMFDIDDPTVLNDTGEREDGTGQGPPR
jgi:hypothetical protein